MHDHFDIGEVFNRRLADLNVFHLQRAVAQIERLVEVLRAATRYDIGLDRIVRLKQTAPIKTGNDAIGL